MQSICEDKEEPLHILKTDFKVDVKGNLLDDPEEQQKVMQKLDELATQGKEVDNILFLLIKGFDFELLLFWIYLLLVFVWGHWGFGVGYFFVSLSR